MSGKRGANGPPKAEVLDVSLREGTYRARLRLPGQDRADAPPRLELRHRGAPLPDVLITHMGAQDWQVKAPLPAALLSDGVHTLHLTMTDGMEVLHGTAIAAGAALDGDLLADLSLLRAELDIVKAALRRLVAAQAE